MCIDLDLDLDLDLEIGGDQCVLKRPRESLDEQATTLESRTHVVREAFNLLKLEVIRVRVAGIIRVIRVRVAG